MTTLPLVVFQLAAVFLQSQEGNLHNIFAFITKKPFGQEVKEQSPSGVTTGCIYPVLTVGGTCHVFQAEFF